MYYHPKYYAALRAERKKLQASSAKPQAAQPDRPSAKHQAPSVKPQAASIKLQAASDKLHNISAFIKFHVTRSEVLCHDECVVRMPYMEGYLVW